MVEWWVGVVVWCSVVVVRVRELGCAAPEMHIWDWDVGDIG